MPVLVKPPHERSPNPAARQKSLLVEYRCREIIRLDGDEASDYTDAHLVEIDVHESGWIIIRYRCPETRAEWLLDWPYDYAHGGGPRRLNRDTDPA